MKTVIYQFQTVKNEKIIEWKERKNLLSSKKPLLLCSKHYLHSSGLALQLWEFGFSVLL